MAFFAGHGARVCVVFHVLFSADLVSQLQSSAKLLGHMVCGKEFEFEGRKLVTLLPSFELAIDKLGDIYGNVFFSN